MQRYTSFTFKTRSEGSKHWGDALEDAFSADQAVKQFRLAIVENLPRFVPKSLVKGQMGKDSPAAPMLIDWEGSSKELIDPLRREEPHVWVFDSQGRLRLRLAAELSEGRLQAIKRRVGLLIQNA